MVHKTKLHTAAPYSQDNQ